MLDTEKYTVRLKAQPEVKAKLIKREGKLEKQYRYLMGNLPVCYKSEPEEVPVPHRRRPFRVQLWQHRRRGGETPVPPCIQQTASGMIQIAIDVEDKARTKAVSRSPRTRSSRARNSWSLRWRVAEFPARCCISDCRRCRCCEVGARVPSC